MRILSNEAWEKQNPSFEKKKKKRKENVTSSQLKKITKKAKGVRCEPEIKTKERKKKSYGMMEIEEPEMNSRDSKKKKRKIQRNRFSI